MKRRDFLLALGGAAFAWPVVAAAQQPTAIPRIGILMGADASEEATKLDAFRGALEKLGYIEGQSMVIEVRYAMGQPDRFSSLARELVELTPSVIVCVGRRETTALLAATRKIPVVFMQVNDPFRAYYKNAFLKQYEKFFTFLHNELVSNNLADFLPQEGIGPPRGGARAFPKHHRPRCYLPGTVAKVHVDFPLLQRLALPNHRRRGSLSQHQDPRPPPHLPPRNPV